MTYIQRVNSNKTIKGFKYNNSYIKGFLCRGSYIEPGPAIFGIKYSAVSSSATESSKSFYLGFTRNGSVENATIKVSKSAVDLNTVTASYYLDDSNFDDVTVAFGSSNTKSLDWYGTSYTSGAYIVKTYSEIAKVYCYASGSWQESKTDKNGNTTYTNKSDQTNGMVKVFRYGQWLTEGLFGYVVLPGHAEGYVSDDTPISTTKQVFAIPSTMYNITSGYGQSASFLLGTASTLSLKVSDDTLYDLILIPRSQTNLLDSDGTSSANAVMGYNIYDNTQIRFQSPGDNPSTELNGFFVENCKTYNYTSGDSTYTGDLYDFTNQTITIPANVNNLVPFGRDYVFRYWNADHRITLQVYWDSNGNIKGDSSKPVTNFDKLVSSSKINTDGTITTTEGSRNVYGFNLKYWNEWTPDPNKGE